METSVVTVGTTAVQLVPHALRNAAAIRNDSSSTIYIGPSGVTTTNGFPLDAGDTITFTRMPVGNAGAAGEVYGIAGTAGNEVRVLVY